MTKVEDLIFSHPAYIAVQNATRDEKQKVLDEIADEVLKNVGAENIITHVREVYDATAEEYANNPHTQSVIDGLIFFMDLLPSGATVLDVGCGPGRDTLFMSVGDGKCRAAQMQGITDGTTTLEKFEVPTNVLNVVGLDNSQKMIELAKARMEELMKRGLLSRRNRFPMFVCGEDMHAKLPSQGQFNAVWSCTALFTHTPRSLMDQAMRSVAGAIKNGGLLFLSYTNGRASGRYNKFLLSSTGRIKYFSQPDPNEIVRLAAGYSLKLESESFSDFEINGKVLEKNLFVSQFFRKM